MDQEITVMQIVRVPPRGKLVVEANGRRYNSLDEVTHPPTRQRILAAIGELVSFAGNYAALVDAGLAPPIRPPESPSAAPEEALAEEQAKFLAALEQERDSLRQAASKPRLPLIPLPGRRPSTAEPPPIVDIVAPKLAAPLSIVEQIDAILQKYLAAEPELAKHDVHLKQADAGLRILVDNRVYERPAEIPDKRIQLAIKMALKEWESRK
jgi:hypothetical protein